jgi:hypothetical protein
LLKTVSAFHAKDVLRIGHNPLYGITYAQSCTPRLDLLALLFPLCSMPVETLGQAFSYGWRVTARCAAGKQDGMSRHKECVYRAELDMET